MIKSKNLLIILFLFIGFFSFADETGSSFFHDLITNKELAEKYTSSGQIFIQQVELALIMELELTEEADIYKIDKIIDRAEEEGRLEEVLKSFEEAAKKEPESVTILIALANVYGRLDLRKKEYEAITRAEEEVQKKPRIVFNLLMVYGGLGTRKSEAGLESIGITTIEQAKKIGDKFWVFVKYDELKAWIERSIMEEEYRFAIWLLDGGLKLKYIDQSYYDLTKTGITSQVTIESTPSEVEFTLYDLSEEPVIEGTTPASCSLIFGDYSIKAQALDYNPFEESLKVGENTQKYSINLKFSEEKIRLEEAERKRKEQEEAARLAKERAEKERLEQEAMKDMALIQAGSFNMGNAEGFANEKPEHQVKISGFYLNKYEAKFIEYDKFCEATARSKPGDEGWGRGMRPVLNVSWYDAIEYCNWLSEKYRFSPCYKIDKSKSDPNNRNKNDAIKWIVTCDFDANGFRLPTEAEWEYAAGGGSEIRGFNYSGGNNPEEVAWYSDNSGAKTQPVGGKKANEPGIYDLTGNLWEWCWDWYGNYGSSSQNDPSGQTSGSARIGRGGSWGDGENMLRCTSRFYGNPNEGNNRLGFRVARTK